MRKLLPAILGVAVVAGGVYALVASASGPYRLATLAPGDTTVWIEAMDLEGQTEAFRGSPVYADFERSKTGEGVQKGWEQLRKLASQGQVAALKELGLELDEQLVHRLVGQNVGLGLLATSGQEDSPPPAAFLMTKIDVVGLAKDVLANDKADWRALWTKLGEVLGGEGAETSEVEGYSIVTRSDLGTELHMALVEDVLVVSHARQPVEAVIRVKVGKTPSLAASAAFDDAVEALPEVPALYTWADMRFVRDPARVAHTAKALAEQLPGARPLASFDPAVLDVLVADLKPIDGLALALDVPEGDLYRASLRTSHTAQDLFREGEARDARTLVSAETLAYGEARGLYDLIVGFGESEAAKALAGTEAAQWLERKLEKPQEVAELAEGQMPLPMKLDRDPTFELRLALALLAVPARELLGNDVAVAVEAHEADDPMKAIKVAAFVRARPVLRIAADLAMGVAEAHPDAVPGLALSEHGGRKIYGVGEGPFGAYAARVGAHLVVTSDEALLQATIDRAASGAAGGIGQDERFAAVVTRLPKDYRVFGFFNMERYQAMAKVIMAQNVGPEQADAMLEQLEAQNDVETLAVAGYVSDDGARWTLRSFTSVREGGPSTTLYQNAQGQPPAWQVLPAESFLTVAAQVDPRAAYDHGLRLAKLGLAEEQVEGLLAQAKERLGGQSLEEAVVAKLGQGLGLALVTQERLPAEGAPAEAQAMMPAVPALVAALQLKDEGLEQTVVGLIRDALREVAEAKQARGYESTVARALNELHFAQSTFRLQQERPRFGTLEELAGAGMLDHPELAAGSYAGFVYGLAVDEEAPDQRWMATARPEGWPESGGRCYAVDQQGIVYISDEAPFELDPTAGVPGDALPLGSSPAPALKVEIDPEDPELLRLVTREVDGIQLHAFAFPEREAKRNLAQLGRAVSPCFAVADGWLLVSSSEDALLRAARAKAQKGSLADDARFTALRKGHPTDVAAFTHVDVTGVIEQVDRNGELLARVLAPAPPKLALPSRPTFPELQDGDDFEAAMAEYEKAQEAYMEAQMEQGQKVAEWRKAHAAENAEALSKILRSLSVLGHGLSTTRIDDDRRGLEATSTWQLELPSKGR